MGTREIDLTKHQVIQETHLNNPFPGLRPFGFEESHLFFGREGQSDDILDNLSRNRFVAVIGASGSGKSSLMFCGLLPVMYGGFMGPAGSEWLIVTARPGNTPIENLAESILAASPDYENLPDEQKETEKLITNIILRSSSYGLVDALKPVIRNRKKQVNILLLIDQFEELFRYIKSSNDPETANTASAFVHLILKSVRQTELPVYAALTMRSDFIGECAQFPDLTYVINRSHYLIPQMTREQQRMAIEGPVAVGGGKITKRLVQQLLNDVGNNPDQLPILQHALMRTWEYWLNNREESEPIDIRHYVAIGKIEEALSQHANETYAELDKKEREVCELIFKALTEKGRENYGIRRSATVAELCSISGVSEGEVINIIEKFRRPGRSLLMPPSNIELRSNTVVEISHESLMRIWDRLKNWVDEEHESAQMYRRLSEAAAMYQIGRTGLWRPPDLQLALNWQKKQIPTRSWAQRYNPFFERAMLFLETSKTAFENEQKSKELLQKNMLKRTRTFAIFMGVVSVVAIVMFIIALYKKIDADDKTLLAQERLVQVGKEQEQALVQAAQARFNAQRAEKQRQYADLQKSEAVRSQEQAEIQRQYAQNQQQIAERQSRLAEQRRIIADSATVEAKSAQRVAVENEKEKNKLLYLQTAQNLAIKSNTVNDLMLQGLMAQQAYKYNKEYEGNKYDPYIYEGLYFALKALTNDSLYLLTGHSGVVRGLAVTPNGKKLYSAGTDGKILSWDMNSPDYEHKQVMDLQSLKVGNLVVKITSDGRWLIAGTNDVGRDKASIYCIDLKNGNSRPIRVSDFGGSITDIIVLPNNENFISLSTDHTLSFSDFANSSPLKKFKENYTRMALSPDGKYIALTGSEDGRLIMLDTKNVDKEYQVIAPGGARIRSVVFSPKGNMLAVGDIEGNVNLINILNGPKAGDTTHILTGQNNKEYINSLLFSKDGKFLASAESDGTIHMWNMNNVDNLPVVFRDNTANVWSLSFSPDDQYLYAGSEDGNIKIWPVQPEIISDQICGRLNRNMTQAEWKKFVSSAGNIPYEKTCDINIP